MKKKERATFNQVKAGYSLRIETDSRYLKKKIEEVNILEQLFGYKGGIEGDKTEKGEDFSLYLSLDSAKRKKKDKTFNKKIFRFKKDGPNREKTFTAYGSYIEVDFWRKHGEGRIIKGDPHDRALIRKVIHSISVFNHSVRLHSAILENGNKTILIGGDKGAGKTTLSRLFKKYKGFNIINDDKVALISGNDKIYGIAKSKYDLDSLLHVSFPSLFIFIYFFPQRFSRWQALSKKEAFKRLVFLSEFPPNENSIQRGKRLDILKKLAEQCQNYLLINGKDLIDDFHEVIKKVNFNFDIVKDFTSPPGL